MEHSLETTASHPILATERDTVIKRLHALREALAVLAERCGSDHTIAEAGKLAERASERLRLSATHTVVAIIGATGVGKSALYNAVSGLELALVSQTRPTTLSPQACIWGPKGADDLLDWLGIDESRRTARESPLDADEEAGLRGLILVDLPDHAMLSAEERNNAERLIERADLLVWVIEPGMYSDDILRERHLRPLIGRAPRMVVLLNKTDLYSAADVEKHVTHARKSLVNDDLPDATVLATSATRGDGIPRVRALFLEAVATRVYGMKRLAADLEGMGRALNVFVGSTVRLGQPGVMAGNSTTDEDSADDTAVLHSGIAEVVDAPSLVDEVAAHHRRSGAAVTDWPVVRWIQRLWEWLADRGDRANPFMVNSSESVLSTLEDGGEGIEVQQRLSAVVQAWSQDVSRELPTPWDKTFRDTVAQETDVTNPHGNLWPAVLHAVRDAEEAREQRSGWWRWVGIGQWSLFAAVVCGAGWLLGWSAWEVAGDVTKPLPVVALVPIPALLVLGGVVGGILLHGASRWVTGIEAEKMRDEIRTKLESRIREAADTHVVAPMRREAGAYDTVCFSLKDF